MANPDPRARDPNGVHPYNVVKGPPTGSK